MFGRLAGNKAFNGIKGIAQKGLSGWNNMAQMEKLMAGVLAPMAVVAGYSAAKLFQDDTQDKRGLPQRGLR